MCRPAKRAADRAAGAESLCRWFDLPQRQISQLQQIEAGGARDMDMGVACKYSAIALSPGHCPRDYPPSRHNQHKRGKGRNHVLENILAGSGARHCRAWGRACGAVPANDNTGEHQSRCRTGQRAGHCHNSAEVAQSQPGAGTAANRLHAGQPAVSPFYDHTGVCKSLWTGRGDSCAGDAALSGTRTDRHDTRLNNYAATVGNVSQIQSAFGTQLRTRELPATATTQAYRYRSPDSAPQLPADIAAPFRVFLASTRGRATGHT